MRLQIVMSNMKKNSSILIVLQFLSLTIFSQEIVEGIVAVVGDKSILKSEVEQQYLQLRPSDLTNDNLRCEVMEELMFQKLLSHHAVIDSLEVSDDDVNDAIDQRINYFISQIGSEKKLEEYFNKSIAQIREEFQFIFKDQLLAQRMESKITSNLKVTPQDVLKFYSKIPHDSLPIFPEEIYLSQLVMYPKVDELEKQRIINKLNKLKKRIEEGEDFSFLASLYSDDSGTANSGGDLGYLKKGKLVPKFESVAFRLQEGELSDIVETKFGFHLIQMVNRRGQEFNVRHILIKPKISSESIRNTKLKLDSIINFMVQDSLSFGQLVIKYSEDESKNNEGKIINPQTGSSSHMLKDLEFSLSSTIGGLKEGECSQPTVFVNLDGRKACRVVYVDRIIEEHKANLKEDYDRIQSVALQEMKVSVLNKWKKNVLKETYIDIKEDFDCRWNDNWMK